MIRERWRSRERKNDTIANRASAHVARAIGPQDGAQIWNLLYRGFGIRRPHNDQRPAEYNSAIRQIENLRHVGERVRDFSPGTFVAKRII